MHSDCLRCQKSTMFRSLIRLLIQRSMSNNLNLSICLVTPTFSVDVSGLYLAPGCFWFVDDNKGFGSQDDLETKTK